MTPVEGVIWVALIMAATFAAVVTAYGAFYLLVRAARSYSKSRLLGSSVMGKLLSKLFPTRCDYEACRARLTDNEGIRWQGIAYCSREHADLAVAMSTSPQ